MSAIYSDLNSFTPTLKPLLEDIESVYQSLYNLFNTVPGERFFSSIPFGFNMDDEIFEMMDELGALQVYAKVVDTVTRWEARVQIDNSRTQVIPDPDSNTYDLNLYFEILGMDGQSFNFKGSFSR